MFIIKNSPLEHKCYKKLSNNSYNFRKKKYKHHYNNLYDLFTIIL